MPTVPDTSRTMNAPTWRVMFIGTGGVLNDTDRAAELREHHLPPTALEGLTTVVLDLSGMTPTPAALREIVVPLGQRLRGGVYGATMLVVATPDKAVAEVIDLLAGAYGLSLYLAESSSSEDIRRARPAGDLTATEKQTLAALAAAGGRATVAALSERVGIEPTAVNNRLAKLDSKGYIYRYRRPRRVGDLYLDPRVPSEAEGAMPSREALRAHGIETNPYDRSPLKLEGEAAQRAAEIIRRRTRGGT
jgi:DNA-binding Lrp family transcriptional regulator